ncbi:MAG: efflux RND transporter periplasmic adaptor subunit [Polyangiaceae bacterium]
MNSRTTKLPIVLGVASVVGAGAIVFFGLLPRMERHRALARTQTEREGPRIVRVTKVLPGPSTSDLVLPGNTVPRETTQVFPRSTGYVRKNHVDIGDRVKTGQLLAEIDAPETDQDVRLATARLEEAQANIHIADRNAQRNGELAEAGVVSKQQADDLRAQANSASAALKTRQAELSRLGTLRGYQRVLAPFDGIVTKRNMDRGALVGPAGAGGLPLFEIAAIDTLRVYVDAPQTLAPNVTVGLDAEVYPPDAPTRVMKGKVVRTAGVLDATTRTLRVEVNVPGGGAVLPGAFAYVKFRVPTPTPPPLLPASALVVRKDGTLAARVENDHVRLVRLQLGRDLGKQLEVLSGLVPGDVVVANPTDDLADGSEVRVAPELRDGGT